MSDPSSNTGPGKPGIPTTSLHLSSGTSSGPSPSSGSMSGLNHSQSFLDLLAAFPGEISGEAPHGANASLEDPRDYSYFDQDDSSHMSGGAGAGFHHPSKGSQAAMQAENLLHPSSFPGEFGGVATVAAAFSASSSANSPFPPPLPISSSALSPGVRRGSRRSSTLAHVEEETPQGSLLPGSTLEEDTRFREEQRAEVSKQLN